MTATRRRMRSRLEIIYTILEICTEASRKTHIMYEAKLSYVQLMQYLNWLIETNLIAVENDNYVTTPKGIILIENLSQSSYGTSSGLLLKLVRSERAIPSEEELQNMRKGIQGFLELRNIVSSKWTGHPTTLEEIRRSRDRGT